MASEAQINWINNLAEKKDLTNASPELRAWLNTPLAVENATNNEVSLLVESLKALPWKPKPIQTYPFSPNTELSELSVWEGKVDKGFYFITDPTDDTEKFFKVEKPEAPSRWAGRTFIHVQASDFFYPVKDAEHRIAILKTIAVDPINAMNQYGIRLGVCGCCGRTLTAVGSRLKGIGPICERRLLGQPTEEQLDILRRLGFKDD